MASGVFLNAVNAQKCFDEADRTLLALSTSGEIDEYRVVSVDENGVQFEHKLPYVDRNEKLKADNKSLITTNDSLKREMHDVKERLRQIEERQQPTDDAILRWEIATKVAEAFSYLLLGEGSAVSETSKAEMAIYSIDNMTELRSLSQQHRIRPNTRTPQTTAASKIYNSIPLCYRQILDYLAREKAPVYSVRAAISHPQVKKSDISVFLAPCFQQQMNPATELLQSVQDMEVVDSVSGELVPMFVEG